jgi:hypothetical protein
MGKKKKGRVDGKRNEKQRGRAAARSAWALLKPFAALKAAAFILSAAT